MKLSKLINATLILRCDWLEVRKVLIVIHTWERVSVKDLLSQHQLTAVRKVAERNKEKFGKYVKRPSSISINNTISINEVFHRVFELWVKTSGPKAEKFESADLR
jgi:hypothetical protein